jgi:hypothetical protein
MPPALCPAHRRIPAGQEGMTARSHPLTLALEAHNPARNHHRAYVVEVGEDLLGDWVVTVHFGRAVRPGRVRTYTHAVASLDEARAFVRSRLRRRLSAPKRLGCGYRLTAAALDPGGELAAWVPDELLAAGQG